MNDFTSYDAADFISKVKLKNADIALYGCGIQARTIICILESLGLGDLIRIFDNNKSKIGQQFCGYEVEDASILNKSSNQIVILTCSFPAQVLRDLESRHRIVSSFPIYCEFEKSS